MDKVIVILIILVSLFFLGRRFWRNWTSSSRGACSCGEEDCNGCSLCEVTGNKNEMVKIEGILSDEIIKKDGD